MSYIVYVLISLKDKKRYVGLTTNLERRLKEHNSGRVKSTKNRCPLELIYFEKLDTKREAERRELFFKSGHGRVYLDKKGAVCNPPMFVAGKSDPPKRLAG